MAEFRQKVGLDSVRTFVGGVIASVLAVLTGIAIANTLGPAGKGEYSGVRLLYDGVISVVGGIGSAITYYLTRRGMPLRALTPSLVRIFVGICVILWAGSALWLVFRGVTVALVAFVVIIPATIIISWQPSLFVSYDRIRYLNYQNITLATVTFVGTAISVWALHTSVVGPIAAWTLGLYAIAGVVVVFALRIFREEHSVSEPVADADLIGFSFRSSLNSVLNFLNARLDSILVISFLGVRGFGIYSMATGVAELIYSLSQAVATSMSRSIGVSDFRTSAAVTAKAVRYNTMIVASVSIAIFLFAPWLIERVYGKPFAPATLPLRILLPGLVLFSSTRIFNAFFTYQLGRPIFSVYLLAAVTVLQGIGCVVLIPIFGLAGAAAASSLAYVIASIGQAWYFSKISGIGQNLLWIPSARDFVQLADVIASTARSSLRLGRRNA